MRPITYMTILLGLAACEKASTTDSTVNAVPVADLYVRVTDADVFFSAPASVTTLGLCQLADEASACDVGVSGFRQAESLGKGKERMFFRLSLGTVDTGAVYHVVDTSAKTTLARYSLVDLAADPVSTGLALMNEATFRSELADLSSDDYNGRLSGTVDNERAAQSIISTLKSLAIEPARPGSYLQEFTLNTGPMAGKNSANVVGLIPGSDPALKDEYVVIGAHMDHAGTLQRGYTCSSGGAGDNICNGADDNGSGTIAVLNVAKSLAAVRGSLKRSVILIWFSGEEEGLLGSKYYVERDPIIPLAKTKYMINLDMVGYMESNGNALAALGAGTSSLGDTIIRDIGRKYPGRTVSPTDRAGGGSDHVPFMAKGIPGVFFHTGVANNRNYHKTSDHADKIDYPGMLVAAKIAYETLVRVANETSLGVKVAAERESFITAEEALQTCHHLMQNPFVQEALPDFRNGN